MSVDLSEDGKRALREAENFCWAANIAIVTPEHLLAGALKGLLQSGREAISSR